MDSMVDINMDLTTASTAFEFGQSSPIDELYEDPERVPTGHYIDENMQMRALVELTGFIEEHAYCTGQRGQGLVIGGIIFEFMDEYWKGPVHDMYATRRTHQGSRHGTARASDSTSHAWVSAARSRSLVGALVLLTGGMGHHMQPGECIVWGV